MKKPDILVGKMTIGDVVDILAENFGDNIGLEYYALDIRKNFRDLRKIFDDVAKGLMALGVNKGDKVAIWANNLPEWVYTQYGSARMGAVLVTVNTNYRSNELEYLLQQSDTTTLILTGGVREADEYLRVLHKVCPTIKDSEPGKLRCDKLPFLKNIVYLGKWANKYPTGSSRKDWILLIPTMSSICSILPEQQAFPRESCFPIPTL